MRRDHFLWTVAAGTDATSFFKRCGGRFGIHLEPVVTVQEGQSLQVYVPAVDQVLNRRSVPVYGSTYSYRYICRALYLYARTGASAGRAVMTPLSPFVSES